MSQSELRLKESSWTKKPWVLLGSIGAQTTLRYVMQFGTPARVLVQTNGSDSICRSDIEEGAALFFEGKKSAQILVSQADAYIAQYKA